MTDMQPMGKIGAFTSDRQPEYDMTGVMDGLHGMEEDTLMPMHTSDSTPTMGSASMATVSREDCCAAVMCMIECCSCPVTKAALMECCEDIMSGDYDNQ